MHARIQKFAFDKIEDINAASDTAAIINILDQAGGTFGYDNFSISGLPQPGEKIDPYIMACRWPGEWAERYVARNYVAIDPVIALTQRSLNPFSWAEATVGQTAQQAAMMDEATEFGLVDGFAVPIYSVSGFQAIVTFGARAWTMSLPEKRALHLVAIYAHNAIRSHLPGANDGRDKRDGHGTRLTGREMDCLKWSAAGKTAVEIAAITGIAARTVEHHLERAATKLNAVNKTQAVATAIRQRIIS
jgi:LuxR family quorum sensing-dependent transcriptional regulator